jgi:hypothetical protein
MTELLIRFLVAFLLIAIPFITFMGILMVVAFVYASIRLLITKICSAGKP